MRNYSKLSVGFACLGLMVAAGDALAKSRAAAAGRQPLVVERRSFLDPGTKVPVGSTNRYMLQQTYYNQDPIQANQRSWYGQETLPQRWNQPWDPGLAIDIDP